MAEIVGKTEFKEAIRPRIKAGNKTIVLCHGVFDLVHPGHMIHFEQAKEMGDVLVVSVTAARFVRKGPGRPYFSDEMRLKFLSGIAHIDYVLLSEGYTVNDIVEAVEPDIYVKGSEYADEGADITGKIKEERELVERHGGRIQYTGGAGVQLHEAHQYRDVRVVRGGQGIYGGLQDEAFHGRNYRVCR